MCSYAYPLCIYLVSSPLLKHVARGEPGPYMWELGVVERHEASVYQALQPGMAWRMKMHLCHTEECITSFAFCFVSCFTCVVVFVFVLLSLRVFPYDHFCMEITSANNAFGSLDKFLLVLHTS